MLMRRFHSLFKYVVSGGSAACVNLGTLYVLTEYGRLHYLQSAMLSFTAAFFVSFLLQKFWTFRNMNREMMHWQMAGFLGVSLVNLFLNTLLIYVLVEYLQLWYVASAIVSGALLAIGSFFIYKYVIFVEREGKHLLHIAAEWLQCNGLVLLTCVAFVLAFFLSTYRLTESPPTWLDEGIITQSALNMSDTGLHTALQSAPGHFVSAGYISTSYPVTYPLAASFALFGTGLLQARAVMALFIIGFVALAYLLLKREMSPWQALAGLLLITSFAPLYGNGKNVLGEVPGLFLLTAFLLFVKRIETRSTTLLDFAGAGLLLGLVVVTKPIFILLLPVVGAVSLFSFKQWTIEKAATAVGGFIAPVWLWLLVQFNGETVGEMFAIYANPHHNDLAFSLVHNVLGFLTQPQPLYAALLLGVWLISLVVRMRGKQEISRVEHIAAGFALLVYAAYVRGAEYYRYFFLGEVFALMYLPKALSTLWSKKLVTLLVVALSLLIATQLYQSFWSSWVADHYDAHRSRALATLGTLPPERSVLVYQAPEAVVFLPTKKYSQYLNILHVAIVGEENRTRLVQGAFDFVVLPHEQIPEVNLSNYIFVRTLDRYSLWERR